jgi:hypothetical protein
MQIFLLFSQKNATTSEEDEENLLSTDLRQFGRFPLKNAQIIKVPISNICSTLGFSFQLQNNAESIVKVSNHAKNRYNVSDTIYERFLTSNFRRQVFKTGCRHVDNATR